MKKSSLVMSVIAASVIAVMASGCNRGPSESEQTASGQGTAAKTLGVTLPNLTNPYYVSMKKSFEEYGAKNGLDIRMLIADNDDAKQLSQVQSFIQQKVDAVAVNCVSSGPCVSLVGELNSAGIPAFTVNILPDGEGMKVQNVSMVQGVQTDQYMGGKFIGEQLLKDMGPDADVTIGIVGEPTSIAALERDQGFKDALKDHPNYKVVALVNGKVEETTSLKVTMEMLQGNPDMNVVYADTEPSALGAKAAIEQLGLADKVKLYAFVDKNGVKAIIDNKILKAGAIQEPDKLARMVVDSVLKNFKGEAMEPLLNSPPLLVDASNASEVIDKAY